MSKKKTPEVPDVFPEHEEPKVLNVSSPDGSVKTYTINELGEDGLGFWSGVVAARTKDGLNDFHGMHEDLIEACITLDGKPVAREVIESWGPKLKGNAYALCEEVNGFRESSATKEGKG